MPKARTKASASVGDILVAWKSAQQQRIKAAISQVSVFVSESRKLKTEIERVVDGISTGAEKVSSAITDGIERRDRAGWDRLVRENGESEAYRLVNEDEDYTATPDQDEADEAVASSLQDVPGADADDAFGQVISALEVLRDQLKEIDAFLRDLK